MKKLNRWASNKGELIGWLHWCPACHQSHLINVEVPTSPFPEFNIAGGQRWSFDGNENSPTFTPSVKVQSGGWKTREGKEVPLITRCHYNITKGQIIYHGDCAHTLKGQTVALPDYPPSAV